MNFIICGDFVTTARGENAIKNSMALSEEIVSILRNSDFSIVNLEAPVADEKMLKIQKVGPHLRTSSKTLEYLKNSGTDIVTLANNHFYDYGKDGVAKTIEACERNGINYVGGGRTQEEYRKILYVEKENRKVAILNYCEHEFSVNKECGSNPMNPINVFYDIRCAKQKADNVIVITHGGHERYNLPSPRMKQLYRFFIDCGANVVVNHHQHCYSGYEEYNNGFICYGLGNFFFDKNDKTFENLGWNIGYMLELEIGEDNKIFTKLYPYNQCLISKPQTWLMTAEDTLRFRNDIAILNEVIKDDNALKKEFDRFSLRNQRNILGWFTPYSCRVLLGLYRKKVLPSFLGKKKILQIRNMLSCESHRDLGINILDYESYIKNSK